MKNNKMGKIIRLMIFAFIMQLSFLVVPVKAEITNIGDTENYGYTGDVQTFTAPYTGVYKLRTWGAQGGSTHGFAGGGGGYSEGKVHLNAGDTLYIYVGGQGAAASAPGESLAGGFNGGGSVTGDPTVNHYTTSGGGATHIATVSGLLSTLENQKDKILIVSGGGGGATWQENYDEFSAGARQGPGGSGGGSNGLLYFQTGINSWIESTWVNENTLIGGTQTAGFAFGQGASNTGGSAGGGGFYGGNTYQRAGAGGSGYIGNPLLTDKHMTMYATNSDYNNTKFNPYTSITTAASETPTDDTPKAGWGYAKVTFLGNNDTTLKTLTVSGYEIMPALRSDKRDYIVFVNEDETSLTLTAETNDTKASVLYNSTISITEDTTTETLTVTAEDGTVGIYTLNIYKQIPSDMGGEYAYTGDVQTFTATKGGLYKLETWGAQGGNANSTYIGGYGGYSTGVVKLKKGETVYIHVGGQGTNCSGERCTAAGGYNGGGNSVGNEVCGSEQELGSGGGATHIATSSGLLSTLENNKNSILIVSGGGGAGNYCNQWNYAAGGSGGGMNGVNSIDLGAPDWNSNGGPAATGGTQISGFAFGRGGTYNLDSIGGGAGYYGGVNSAINGAGGGSGYIGSTRLTTTDQVTKHMSCYNCTTSDAESTKTISNTCHSSAATADCAKEGDGYARIMFIEEYTSDATLSFLSVTNYELDKKFNSNKYEYSLPTFEETVETIEINATPNDYNASVSGDGIINVPYGKSTHEIIVTAQDGTIGIYKIKLNREATPEDEYSYNYTGDVQEFIAPVTGKYKLETWGAQGGYAYTDNVNGGYGGYSTGTISLKANDYLYIVVGGQGESNCQTTNCQGGYNGGSNSNKWKNEDGTGLWTGAGGGATHIATQTGVLSSLSSNQSSVLIVSGGGGGGDYYTWSDRDPSYTDGTSYGGSGGGFKGVTGPADPEHQITNEAGGQTGTYFGRGYTTLTTDSTGGSGGGWYGGISSEVHATGSGGSGYIGNTKLIDKHMTCYKCETSSEESTKTSSTACFSISPKDDCAKRGNGYAKITPLGIESEDATLKSLTVTNQELKQAFDPERLEYDLVLDEDVTSVEINAEANDEKASLTYNQNVELTSNPQLEEIIVTAQDGTINVYSINIKRAKKSYLKKWLDTKFYLIADNQSDSITTLRKATTAEYNAAKDSFSDLNTISLANSPYPAYAWKDNDSILFYSEADIVYMNPDSMQYFTTFKNATSIDLSFFDTSNVTNMSFMFKDLSKLTSLDVSNFDTSKVTNMNCLFSGVSSITSLDVSNFDTSKVTYMNGTFANLKSLNDLDLSNFDTSNVTDMGSMFENTIVLDGIDLSSFDTSNVKNMHNMFYNTKTPKLDLKHFDVSKVNDFGSIFTLTDVDEIDISGWVFNVSSLSSIFYKSKVTKLILDDVDTSSLTTMRSMFSGLLKLKEVDLSSLDTENVTDMSYMFYASDSIETLDLSSFDTRKVTTMENMFTTNNSETALRSINLSSFKVYNVTTMYGMFEDAKHLESIDLSSFDVSSVTTMERMFYNCNSLKTIDLSNFNSPQLTNISGMFGSNNNLERIYANESFSTENVVYSSVFKGCAKLVGGMGTMYSLSNIKSTYARVDDPENGRPGYFTYKEFKPTIYYPDDTFEEVTFNSLFTFPKNWPKENENVSTVTFKYQNGEEDYISNVTKSFDLYRWKVNDSTYSPSSDKNIIADTYLEPIYNETIEGAEFPENLTSEHGTFLGWYTEPTGGERVTSYKGEEDITLYAHWNYDNMTISFEENGGEEISDITVPYRSEIGELPTTTKTGFILEGWYLDEELTNKASSTKVVNDNMTLYAKWIEDDFPIVYQDDEEVFDGTNYLNTHIKLYNEENYLKDYEIGFTITEFDPALNQEENLTFVNAKYENESLGWPGLVVRYNYISDIISISQSINGERKMETIEPPQINKKYRIIRKDNVVYYSVDNGELVEFQDTTGFNQFHEVETTFGASQDIDGNPFRFIHAKLSNMYIRLGEAHDDHMVTYPDGNVEIYPHNTIINLGNNNSTKSDEESATVTFKYHNGSEDTTSKVTTKYTANGFKIDDTHYDDSTTLLVDSDKIIEYDYDESVSTAFPEDPTKEHYTFDGWYTEEVDGDKVENYDREEDITLHAHWEVIMKTITTPDGDVTVPEGSNYSLGTNDTPKDDITNDVTFKYHDNETDDLVKQVTKTYTPNGWLVNDVHYDDEASFEVTEDVTIEPDYIEVVIPVEFPSEPVREHYTFDGWYTEETGGEKIESYSLDEDITLHAHWIGETQTITIPDGEEVVPYGTEYDLGTNDISKVDDKYTVTFKYHDDVTGDLEKEVTVQFTPNGWLVNDVHYDDEASFEVKENTVIKPDYIETVIGAEFPSEPTRDNYEFVGWFDAEEDGTEYTEYSEKADITLHAQWTEEMVHVTLPGQEFDIPKGTEVDIPPNYITKPAEIISSVHLHYNNNDDDDDMLIKYMIQMVGK